MNINEWIEAGKPWNVILHGDCMDLMKHFNDKEIPLCITDPPYGINADGMNLGNGIKKYKVEKKWDSSIPDKSYFDELERISQNRIIWGGNYFVEYIGNFKCFLIWNKIYRRIYKSREVV